MSLNDDPALVQPSPLPPTPQPSRRVFVAGPATGTLGTRDAAGTMLRIAGSKYYTLRYLLVALLAEGESLVRGPAISEDTAVLVRALRALGASAEWEPDGAGWALRVRGVAGRPQVPAGGVLAMGNAGAVLRLLLGLGALLPTVRFETDHPASLGRRPNSDLLTALATLGLQVEAQGTDGLLPITLRGGPLRGGPPRGGAVSVSGARSSQYLSALLYLAPLLPLGLEITVSGDLRSTPLVRATLRVLAAAGITLEAAPDLRRFRVPGGQRYRAGVYDVPGDAPSAAALLAAALALRAPLRLAGLAPDAEDARALLGALAALGAPLAWQSAAGGGTASGDPVDGTSASTAPGSVLTLAVADLQGAVIDGDALIDSIPALAAAACFATGRSRFENVATLRLKESDRIGDLCAELRHAGGDAEPLPDAIAVCGQPEGIAGGAEVEGHDDHRLVQALAVAALRSRAGLFISGAEAVAKSYPTFFDDLTRLGARVEEA